MADEVCELAFGRGLLIESSGADSHVIKLLPPLTISEETLMEGLAILAEAFGEAAERRFQVAAA
ncbi:MAG: hypothetical protein IOD05_17110 [Rhodobacter sp.]|nr:hypothetical protein [Rhodobacter sp.]